MFRKAVAKPSSEGLSEWDFKACDDRETAAYFAYVRISRASVTPKSPSRIPCKLFSLGLAISASQRAILRVAEDGIYILGGRDATLVGAMVVAGDVLLIEDRGFLEGLILVSPLEELVDQGHTHKLTILHLAELGSAWVSIYIYSYLVYAR